MTVKLRAAAFEGKCTVCKRQIPIGQEIVYVPVMKYTAHRECAQLCSPREYLVGYMGQALIRVDTALSLQCVATEQRERLSEWRDRIIEAIARVEASDDFVSALSDEEVKRCLHRLETIAMRAEEFLEEHRRHFGAPTYPKCAHQPIP